MVQWYGVKNLGLTDLRFPGVQPDGPAKNSAWKAWAVWQAGAPFGASHLFVERDQRKAAALDPKDKNCRSHLRLMVDSLGESRIELLDDSGRVATDYRDR